MALSNPYALGSNEYVDFEIWNNGVNRFYSTSLRYSRRSKVPHELDYLRGFHEVGSLAAIQAQLASQTGKKVQVTSIWLDKTAYVIPRTLGILPARRELADLAVVLRDHHLKSQCMWILQAKKGDIPGGSLGSGKSTLKEIELFEESPKFELEPFTKGAGAIFDLEPEFGPSTAAANYQHWSFLMFRETPAFPTPPVFTPTQWRWDGSSKTPKGGSFMAGICDMLPNVRKKGAILNAGGDWANLHQALMNHIPTSRILGHAAGPMRISTFCGISATATKNFIYRSDGDHFSDITSKRWLYWDGARNIKFDKITTGFNEVADSFSSWKRYMDESERWEKVDKKISNSIDQSIGEDDGESHRDDSLLNEYGFPPGGGGNDGSGGENDGGGGGGGGARATLVIDIDRSF